MTLKTRQTAKFPSFPLGLKPRELQPVTVLSTLVMASVCGLGSGAFTQAIGSASASSSPSPHSTEYYCKQSDFARAQDTHQQQQQRIPSSSDHNASAAIQHAPYYRSNFTAARVIENLFLGAYSDAISINDLKQRNITHVLNVAAECLIPDDIQKALRTKSIPLQDHSDENIAAHFEECSEFIRSALEKGEGVLVHCRMGISRSATVVMAYLMKYGTNLQRPEVTSYDVAFQQVKATRPEVCPNFGFSVALREEDVRLGFRKTPWDENSSSSTSSQYLRSAGTSETHSLSSQSSPNMPSSVTSPEMNQTYSPMAATRVQYQPTAAALNLRNLALQFPLTPLVESGITGTPSAWDTANETPPPAQQMPKESPQSVTSPIVRETTSGP